MGLSRLGPSGWAGDGAARLVGVVWVATLMWRELMVPDRIRLERLVELSA